MEATMWKTEKVNIHLNDVVLAVGAFRSDGRLASPLNKAVEVLLSHEKIWTFGNGGSFAVAQHLASDLCSVGIASSCLGTNLSLVTATANDIDYSEAANREFELLRNLGDCLVLFSVSGSSLNVLRLLEGALKVGITVVYFTGSTTSFSPRKGLFHVKVPSEDFEVVEDVFSVMTHYIKKEAIK